MLTRAFDVVIAGGGLAGSFLGGVLARSGLGVLVVEKEGEFRDRIRGELTWPWGHYEALRAGLGEPLAEARAVPVTAYDIYEDAQVVESVVLGTVSLDGLSGIGFSHPRLQEVAFAWADSQGVTTLRPAKVVEATGGDRPRVSVVSDGRETEVQARLVVGADGKTSGARQWLGAETVTDPRHHMFGGLLVSGARWNDTFGWASAPTEAVGWLMTGPYTCRVYIRLAADRVRETGVGRDADVFIRFAAGCMPAGVLEDARPAGPMAFFPNSCTWSSRIAHQGLVLVGDAAGALDPTQGLGTSLLFRDVRELSELLLADQDWDHAIGEFERQRRAYYDVLRAYDLWSALLDAEEGPEADRRRELNAVAREEDPTLGGFGLLEVRGPDGLVPDEAARRTFFGE